MPPWGRTPHRLHTSWPNRSSAEPWPGALPPWLLASAALTACDHPTSPGVRFFERAIWAIAALSRRGHDRGARHRGDRPLPSALFADKKIAVLPVILPAGACCVGRGGAGLVRLHPLSEVIINKTQRRDILADPLRGMAEPRDSRRRLCPGLSGIRDGSKVEVLVGVDAKVLDRGQIVRSRWGGPRIAAFSPGRQEFQSASQGPFRARRRAGVSCIRLLDRQRSGRQGQLRRRGLHS